MGINLPNGANVEEIVLPNGSQASEVIGPDGSTVWERVAIPDTQIYRDADDTDTNNNNTDGLEFVTDASWSEFGAEISSLTSGLTRAYIYRRGDGELLGETDITGLDGGDTFTITLDENIDPHDGTDETVYDIVADAEGDDATTGRLEDAGEFVSDDGNLTIRGGVRYSDGLFDETLDVMYSIVGIGNVGFD